ncbi:hypothetical protein DHD05_05440 [Arenibacter sp. N53]|nr:hypothetical protein [Arenibacter sp. N53]
MVFGGDNEAIAFEIAEHTPLKVIVFETSENKVKKLREAWQGTGLYGGKITIQHTDSYNALPITSDVANVVVVNTADRSSADEVIRLIKPKGYGVLKREKVQYADWLAAAKNIWQVSHTKNEVVEVLSKAPHDSTGEWSHQYGLPNNSAFGGESLWGSTTTNDFEIQWMGRPGPRFQTDRSGRKPSPLAVNGKMFVQGRERIIAVDAYNGSVFWSKEIPGLSRMNIIRDCSNWSADDNYVYIAHQSNLLKINNSNGNMTNIVPVTEDVDLMETDWGYISLLNDNIIGTSIPKGSNYTNYYGGEGWYDKQSGPLAHQVVSFSMFAKKKDGNDNIWEYKKPKSHIINSTITITDNQICFVESRNSGFKLSDEGRAGPKIFKNTFLVSLNPDTGKVNWEKPLQVQPGLAAFFMAGSSDRIVIVSSYEGMYYIYNHDSKTGDFVWENQLKWPANHHGAHFSKPAIVGNRLIVKPGIFKLDTGELLEQEVPKAGHGCASYALTEQSAFYRGYSVTQFNFDTDKFTQWERLRPDCWLSTIPAQGMILSPEAGGGCSCGNWLETSMVFAPKSRAPITYLYENEEFMDTLSINIKTKDGNFNTLFYTLDGSEPTKRSTQYKKPIVINKNTTLKSIIYVDKSGREASYVRTRNFTRLRPEPTITALPELNNGKWSFSMERKGNSGEIHFTTDGTTPSLNSPKYRNPVAISDNTLVRAITFWKEGNEVLKSEENSLEVIIPELIDAVNIDAIPGIIRNYYKNNGKTGNELPDLGAMVPKKSDLVNEIDLATFDQDKMYGLRFKGYINIPTDGMYTFSNVTAAAFSTVYLSDENILETKPGAGDQSVVVPLKKGLHALMADYFVGNEAQGINLKLQGPNMKNAAIPAELLYHSK